MTRREDGTAPALRCHGVGVTYGPDVVLTSVDLRVAAGEAVAVLGPSGSGKTTLLHAIAGFVPLAAGEVRVGGRRVAGDRLDVPPEARGVGYVFQHYALWPHMSALETVAYPLRRAGLRPRAARERAQALLESMGVGGLAARRPAAMSGGQQQRVGVARALARDARLFLLDEPTAHLDTTMRASLQVEVAQRRRELGAAALYATHDAGEALAVADRVALLRDGTIAQIGEPREVYERPLDAWVARLTGPASVVRAHLTGGRAGLELRLADGCVVVDQPAPARAGVQPVLVRPEWAALGGPLAGRVAGVWYRGPHTDYRVATSSGDVTIRCAGAARSRVGDRVSWRLHRVHVLADAPPPEA